MKKTILLLFIGYTALHAQIAIKYALPPTNGTLQKMEYSSWGRAYIDQNGLPDITNPADERVLVTYKDGKPHLVQSFRVRQSETIPYMQVEFLYKGTEIASVKEYNNTGFPNKNEFKVTKTSIPQYEKGVMVSEIILDKNDKQVGFVKYELTNLPLIIGDNYTVNNRDTVKTGRSGIQFDGQIHQTQFEINGSSDTLYAMSKIRDTKDGYISYFMAKGMSGEAHRLTYQVQIKKDHQKNIVSMITREVASPAKTKGSVTTYRYQYKGDPEWPTLEVASVFPEAILSPRAWGNDQKNILLVFSKGKSQHEGIWISKTFQPIPDQNQYKGTFFEQIYELQKAKKGDWKYLPASQQIELLQNGQRIALFRMELTGKNSLKLQSDGYYDFLKLTRFDVTEEKPVEVKNDKPSELVAAEDAMVEVSPPPPPKDPNEVHTIVETQPSFPGGESAMLQYMIMNLKYPTLAKENGVEGKVIVSFIVEKEGALTDLKVVRDIGAGCGAAAMDMIRSMPKWKPGQHRGETVRAKYTLPIRFKLSK